MEQQSPVKPDNIKPQEKMEIKSKYYECYLSWHGEYCDNVPHINFCQFHEMELQKHNSQNGVKEGIVTILFFKVLLFFKVTFVFAYIKNNLPYTTLKLWLKKFDLHFSSILGMIIFCLESLDIVCYI